MKRRLLFLATSLTIVALLVSTCSLQTAEGNTIRYSWTGQLRLNNVASPDPWLIGADGAEFRLQTTVNSNAIDLNDTQVSFASFTAIAARLWVDGEETIFSGGANIDFVDTVDIFDFVTAGGLFNMFGQTLDISSVIAIDASAFSLNLVSETPPLFDSTITATLGEVITQPYVTSVSIGTRVTVVPEPNGFLLLSGGLLAQASRRHR